MKFLNYVLSLEELPVRFLFSFLMVIHFFIFPPLRLFFLIPKERYFAALLIYDDVDIHSIAGLKACFNSYRDMFRDIWAKGQS
jgi:hypothetical protein